MPLTYTYLRVSGKAQVEGDGFPRQREATQRWAAQNGRRIAKEFPEEGVSGKCGLDERPVLADLLNVAKKGDTILVERSDRWARDLVVGELLLTACRDKGIRVIECDGGAELTVTDDENPTKNFVRQVLAAAAQLDRALIVAKLRAGRARRKRETGICEGVKPFGLDPKRPEEHPIRERLLSLWQTGAEFHEIAAALNDDGYRTRKGCQWNYRTVEKVVKKHQVITEALSCRS